MSYFCTNIGFVFVTYKNVTYKNVTYKNATYKNVKFSIPQLLILGAAIIDGILWLALADITINKLYHGKQIANRSH